MSYLDVNLEEDKIKALARELKQSLNLPPDRALRVARKKLAFDVAKPDNPADFFNPPQSRNSFLDSLLKGTGIKMVEPPSLGIGPGGDLMAYPQASDEMLQAARLAMSDVPLPEKTLKPPFSINTFLDSLIEGDSAQIAENKANTMFELQKAEGLYDRPEQFFEPEKKPSPPQFMTTPADVRGQQRMPSLDNLTRKGLRSLKNIINSGLIEPVRNMYAQSGPGEFETAMNVLESKEFDDLLNKPLPKKDGKTVVNIAEITKEINKIAKNEQQKVAAKKIPTLEVSPAETKGEKALDFVSRTVGGIGGFMLRLWAMKKLVGGPQSVTRDTLAWELENQSQGGFPGKGAAIKTGLGAIEKIPTVSKAGKATKIGTGGAFYGGLTLAQGGSLEEVVTNTLIGAGFQAWGIHKQNQFLKELKSHLRKEAYAKSQRNISQKNKEAYRNYQKEVARIEKSGGPERSKQLDAAKYNYQKKLDGITAVAGDVLRRDAKAIDRTVDVIARQVHHGQVKGKEKELAKKIVEKGVTRATARELEKTTKLKTPKKEPELAKNGYPEELKPDQVRVAPTTRAARKAGAEVTRKAAA